MTMVRGDSKVLEILRAFGVENPEMVHRFTFDVAADSLATVTVEYAAEVYADEVVRVLKRYMLVEANQDVAVPL